MFGKMKAFFHKTTPPTPPKPSWEEAVALMSDRPITGFSDEIVQVIYSKNKEHRLITLKSQKNGCYYYVVEHLETVDDELWACIADKPDALPAVWVDANNGARSVFGTVQELLNDVTTTAEYKTFFKN